jgi:isopenicillin N synthase-like dioxygenase
MSVPAADLESRDDKAMFRVHRAVQSAFSSVDGPGVLVVSHLPAWYMATRSQLLATAREFGALPISVQAAYERSGVDFAVGWSRGREQFRGVVDTFKGSYYANPVYDDPSHGDTVRQARFPHLLTPNVWPAAHDCDMEAPFKKIGSYIAALGSHLAWHCDKYVASVVDHQFCKLHQSLAASRAQKGRLLHYFPSPLSSEPDGGDAVATSGKKCGGEDGEALWCGFHNDHGTLTGLVAAEYYSEADQAVLSNAPDDRAGLYVSRFGIEEPVRVQYAADCLAFQIGEAAQIMTGGILRATPHAVRTPRDGIGSICRSTMAVFLQPEPDELLELPAWDMAGHAALRTNPLVPALSTRYCIGDTFASFGGKTVASYSVAASISGE